MAAPRRAFLDVDIGGHRAAHARAEAFVAATSLRYGLSSPALAELGGSERARLPELYAADHEWGARGPIALAPAAAERIVVELLEEAAPNCAANFAALCDGGRGKAKGSGLPLSYKGARLHRLVPGMMVQGGDFVKGNGAGGESVFGGTFKDEKGALAIKLDRRGLVAMSNTGKNSEHGRARGGERARRRLHGERVANVRRSSDRPRRASTIAAPALPRLRTLSCSQRPLDSPRPPAPPFSLLAGNGSQFFITLSAQPKLSGKHCVFGSVVSGLEVLEAIEGVGADDGERPLREIVVANCGLL